MNAQAQLDKHSPYIMQGILQDIEEHEMFASFFRSNCPRFSDFQVHLADSFVDGKGFDLQMHSVHSEFLGLLEKFVEDRLSSIGVTVEAWETASMSGYLATDHTVTRMVQLLNSFEDFTSFGIMMQSIYAKRYGDGSHENDVSGVIEANAVVVKPAHVTPVKMTANYVPASPTTAPSMASTATQSPTKFTRVLWDIENIRVSKLGGLETVSRLQAFLSHHNALSPGVDFRITAFFHPSNVAAVPKTVAESLDRAAVELVWVGNKREDADRKLGLRINQELNVLPKGNDGTDELNPRASGVVFVIISSDQDFRHHCQLLRNAGHRVLVLHQANTANWRQTLAINATECFDWDMDVMGLHSNTHTHSAERKTRQRKVNASDSVDLNTVTGSGKKDKRKQGQQTHMQSNGGPAAAGRSSSTVSSAMLNNIHGRTWVIAKVTKWLKNYGFAEVVSICEDVHGGDGKNIGGTSSSSCAAEASKVCKDGPIISPVAPGQLVYVHMTALSPGKRSAVNNTVHESSVSSASASYKAVVTGTTNEQCTASGSVPSGAMTHAKGDMLEVCVEYGPKGWRAIGGNSYVNIDKTRLSEKH